MRGDRQAPPSAADDLARARDALAAIPPDLPRADWIRVGQAAHAAGLAFEDFDTWSAGGATYDPRAARDVWRSFHANGGIGAGTLFFVAKTHGWHDDPAAPRPPPPTAAELARQKAEQAEAKAAKTAERQRKADAAAADAVQRHAVAAPADPAHPYRTLKRFDLTPAMRQEGSTLVVPVTRLDGTVRGLQLIAADGTKRFSRGTSFAGCLWWARPPADESAPCLVLIAEGVATALTVAAAVDGVVDGAAVACAFSAGNIPAIAAALRELFPAADIIIAADADKAGRAAADEAAAAAGAIVRLPTFADPGAQLGGKAAKDWNDLASLEGLDAVRRQLHGLPADPDATPAAEPPPDDPATADPAAPANPAAEGPHGADTAGAFGLPQVCPYGDGAFVVRGRGVYYTPPDDPKGNAQPDRWICGQLRIVAQTRDPSGVEWGRLLEWTDPDGKLWRFAVPLELLQGDGGDVRRELARRGLAIATGRSSRELLAAYIQAWPVETRARCVDRLGWLGGAYVLPDQVIGTADGGEEVVFQGKAAAEAAHATAGTLDDWRQTVAALAAGNSRLVFAIAASLAGPLLHVLGGESGGFHLRGRSSSGKSTALHVGASIWGGPDFVRPWRATPSGLEGVAALHSDLCAFFDELVECDARDVWKIIYMLANERGKARASATGTARPIAHWRLLFLSTGELSLEAHLAAAGQRIAAGQEVRLADIEADAGAGMGVFEVLHGHPSPAALALAIKEAAARYHGTAGVAWLHWLVARRAAIAEAGRNMLDRFVASVVPAGSSGQVARVARRFGLVAVAGELASRAGITGWTQGESIHAVQACFQAWLAGFGGAADREVRAILDQVRGFFEVHGASRFEDISQEHGQRVPNRAGFYRHADGVRTFMVLPGVFRNEVCAGLDQRTVIRVLIAHGWLDPENDRHAAQRLRPPGMGLTRLYVFTEKIWCSENDE